MRGSAFSIGFEAVKAALAPEQANRNLLESERDALKHQIDALAEDPQQRAVLEGC